MSGKKKVGLILGKFMPLHKGHEFLINTAIENCDHLYILLCSRSVEPISGTARLLDLYCLERKFEKVTILHLKRDDMPQEPKHDEDSEFWMDWKNEIISRIQDPIDLVFSSEMYGYKLAETLNAKHHLVDLNRETYPISGTKMRSNIKENWDFIPDILKSKKRIKVAICGPESCGKSTLTKLLADNFNAKHSNEWARDNWDDLGWDMKSYDYYRIAIGQFDYIIKDSENSNFIYFSDTCLIETIIYHELYIGKKSKSLDSLLLNLNAKVDHILLLTPEVPWVQDGLRKEQYTRSVLYDKFFNLVVNSRIPFTVITGDCFEDRKMQAINVCDKLISNIHER